MINFLWTTPTTELSELIGIVCMGSWPPNCYQSGWSILAKPLIFYPLLIEAMQWTATRLGLDDIFLFWVVVVNLESLEVFLALRLGVEVDLCTKVLLANMGLSELLDNCIVWYVEELWVLDRSEDKHPVTSPPKIVSGHLMYSRLTSFGELSD